MKINVESLTRNKTGELFIESGVIKYSDGEISHVVYEKNKGNMIHEFVEKPIEKVAEAVEEKPQKKKRK
jgi:hypothetical protein